MRVINSVDLYEAYNEELLDEGLRSRLKKLFSGKKAKAEDQPKSMSRGEQLRQKYGITSRIGENSPRGRLMSRTQAQITADEHKYGKGSVPHQESQAARNRYVRGAASAYGFDRPSAGQSGARGNKANRRASQINAEFELWVNELVNEGYDLSENTWDDMYDLYESYDSYLTVIGYLLDEGYADDVELAEEMITYMSDDWLESIIEG